MTRMRWPVGVTSRLTILEPNAVDYETWILARELRTWYPVPSMLNFAQSRTGARAHLRSRERLAMNMFRPRVHVQAATRRLLRER